MSQSEIPTTPSGASCECHEHEQQVCDVCQSVGLSSVGLSRDLGGYADALNEFLFENLNADVSKIVWLSEGRWLLADCEEPGLYVIEMYPVKAVRDA